MASLKMRQAWSGLQPCGEVLWHTDTHALKNVLVEGEMFYAIIYIASEFVLREFVKNQRRVSRARGGALGSVVGLALG